MLLDAASSVKLSAQADEFFLKLQNDSRELSRNAACGEAPVETTEGRPQHSAADQLWTTGSQDTQRCTCHAVS